MNRTFSAVSATTLFGCAALAQSAFADGFIEDSSATLLLRNFYLDRDYKDDGARSALREWAQGFILKYSSGYTQGTLGFGFDVQAFYGLKLDSAPDRSGTGLLPVHGDGRAADEYGELGLTAKMRVSRTELLLGTQYPMLPIALAPYSRLFPQTFRGASARSEEVEGLSLHAGWFDRVNLRDSTDYERIGVGSPNGRFDRTARSNRFAYLGGNYERSPELALSYFHAELEDLYKQDYAGFLHRLPLSVGSLKTDFRFFDSREEGASKAGKVDSRNLSLTLTYTLGAHSLGTGYMRLWGETAMPYISGGDPHVMSEGSLSADFLNPKERVWQLRYDYDFAANGLPGLTGILRYVEGSDIKLPEPLGGKDREESEKQVAFSYVVQSGRLKGLGLRLRQSWYRNNFGPGASFRDDNELRINADYAFDLW